MSSEWLNELEQAVRRASGRIAELRRERDELREQVANLNTKLEATAKAPPAAGAPGEGSPAQPDAEAAAWRKDRQEIRRRVEGLTATLEDLLEDEG